MYTCYKCHVIYFEKYIHLQNIIKVRHGRDSNLEVKHFWNR